MFGGRTSEPAIVQMTRIVEHHHDLAEAVGALLVMLVDKGFNCVKRACSEMGALCFMPDAVTEQKQLQRHRAEYNRGQSQLRVPVEHAYGQLKLMMRKLRRGVQQLAAPKKRPFHQVLFWGFL